MTIILVTLCLLALVHFGSAETGCPDPEEVLPCVCTNDGKTILKCNGVNEAEDLRRVFRNSARYHYAEVHIWSSVLQFLPQDMFKSVNVTALYLLDVTLTKLFDTQPADLEDLRTLEIQSTFVYRGIIWQLLEPLKGLRQLRIVYSEVKSLGSEFSQYATKDIKELTLYRTKTKSLLSGVFTDFKKLDHITVSYGNLKTLKRDIFPVPYNGQFLNFNDNKISSISNDLFTQMPNLRVISLHMNQITTVPESAFDGNFGHLFYLKLGGNPIRCDCLMQWITIKKVDVEFNATCVSPSRMEGKKLDDLKPGDFNC